MDRQTIINELGSLISEYLNNQGLVFVDLIYRYEGRDISLRILVDKPEGGITLDECARLNQEISLILDEKGILEQRYILEVSSPGLDRPLVKEEDFLRCMNRKVKVFLNEAIDGRREIDGIITKVEEGLVSIDADGMILKIPLSKVNRAKQVV